MSTNLAIYQSPAYKPEPSDYLILHLAMLNKSVREIAQEVQEPQARIKALLAGPWARDQITQYHERFMATMQARAFDHTKAFADKLKERMEQLDGFTKDPNPSVALRAIELWVNHAIGSPVKRSEVTHTSPLQGMSERELAFVRDNKRLPTPEERLQLANPGYDVESEASDD